MGLDKASEIQHLSRCWHLAAVAAVIAVALQLGGDGVREALAYNREYLASGQLWRLATGHFVHLGWTHLLLNLSGLALVFWLVGHAFSWRQWLYITGISIATIDAGFWFLYAELGWYVGLSGLLHGLLAAGLLRGLLARDREESTSGGTVIVDAHLYGALGGLMGAASMWRRVRSTSPI
jgi:rhomboid family GlyGly-CTERM serine protease